MSEKGYFVMLIVCAKALAFRPDYGYAQNRENAISGGCLTKQHGIKDSLKLIKLLFPVF